MTGKGRKYCPNLLPIEIRQWRVIDHKTHAVKRLVTCCNILGTEIPTGIKVGFENTVSEILLDYTYLEDHNSML